MRLGEGIISPRIIKSYNSFYEKILDKHKDTYDYSESIFTHDTHKMKFICREHGEFYQTPEQHLRAKTPCIQCSRTKVANDKVIPFQIFVEKANIKHSGKYVYVEDTYISMSTPMEILCPEHGSFFKTPTSHIGKQRGTDCPKCYIHPTQSNTEEFIEKAKIIHGEAFDYSKVVYEKANKKVQIKCNTCGHTFFQKPNNHLVGKGCRVCADLAMRNTQEEFEYRAKQIHGNIYNYTNTVYTTYHEPITIMCNTHGEFSTTPNMFLAGYGCPRCTISVPLKVKYEFTPTIFYVIKFKGLYKIGITLETAIQRYKWEVDNTDEIEVLEEIVFDGYGKAHTFEQFMLTKYYKYKYYGEKIFKHTGITEVFTENVYQMYLEETLNG